MADVTYLLTLKKHKETPPFLSLKRTYSHFLCIFLCDHGIPWCDAMLVIAVIKQQSLIVAEIEVEFNDKAELT